MGFLTVFMVHCGKGTIDQGLDIKSSTVTYHLCDCGHLSSNFNSSSLSTKSEWQEYPLVSTSEVSYEG